jgi:hypothetical protein
MCDTMDVTSDGIPICCNAAASQSFMATHGISHEEVERSVRLLTLCSLGAQQSVLPYGVIATALKVRCVLYCAVLVRNVSARFASHRPNQVQDNAKQLRVSFDGCLEAS